MKTLRLSILAALSCLALGGARVAYADEGLALTPKLDQTAWPRLQGRLQLNALDGSGGPLGEQRGMSRLLSASLLGDYYLTSSGLGQHSAGGLRATSGLLFGPMSLALGSSSLSAPSGLSLNRRPSSLWYAPTDSADASTTLPYIGIGYTGQSTTGTWGFKADFGLVGVGTSNRVRLGNSPPQGLDEILREMRFKPLIQVGVSYAF